MQLPAAWGRLAARAFARSWGRDVMLYTGGVSFFAILAVFPAIAILIGFYKAVLSIGQVSQQAAAFADVVPTAARALFLQEIERLASTSVRTVSTQSVLALIIGGYAAHRGFKALLAGLNLIHDETEPHGFFKFNMLAFLVALAAFVLFTVVSGAAVTSRLLEHTHAEDPVGWLVLPLHGMWPAIGLCFGLTMLYRYAMSHATRVAWRPALIGGLVATGMSCIFSWLCAIYVEQIVHLGATYGSVGAVVVLLIWLSWNVNAIFYGGALATELELLQQAQSDDKTETARGAAVVNLADRRRSQPSSPARLPASRSQSPDHPALASGTARRCAPWDQSPRAAAVSPWVDFAWLFAGVATGLGTCAHAHQPQSTGSCL